VERAEIASLSRTTSFQGSETDVNAADHDKIFGLRSPSP